MEYQSDKLRPSLCQSRSFSFLFCLRRKTRSARRKEARRVFGGRSFARPKTSPQAFVRCFSGAKAPPKNTPQNNSVPPSSARSVFRAAGSFGKGKPLSDQHSGQLLQGAPRNRTSAGGAGGPPADERAKKEENDQCFPKSHAQRRGWKPHLRKLCDGRSEGTAPLPGVRHLAAPMHGKRGKKKIPGEGSGRTSPPAPWLFQAIRRGGGMRRAGLPLRG